jgi:hypothetical protein
MPEEWRKQNNLKKRQQREQKAARFSNSTEAAIVYAPQLRRESVLTEMMNQLFSIEWANNELGDVWMILKNLRSLMSAHEAGAAS